MFGFFDIANTNDLLAFFFMLYLWRTCVSQTRRVVLFVAGSFNGTSKKSIISSCLLRFIQPIMTSALNKKE